MKINNVRLLLIICNFLFIVLGVTVFYIVSPPLHRTAERIIINDTKAQLLIYSDYIAEAIENESFKGNYGLTTYLIPNSRSGELMHYMYSFYIININGTLLYSTKPEYKDIVNFRKFSYIRSAFAYQDSTGMTIGALGNEIQYTIRRMTVNGQNFLAVYEVDMFEVRKGVLAFQFIFYIGFFASELIILFLSIYVDRQYTTISNNRDGLIDTYKILDDTGLTTEKYLKRIKKVLHTFSFTTAKLFAINYQGEVIFRNKSTLEAQLERFGEMISIAKTSDESPWKDYRDSWVNAVAELLSTDLDHVEWQMLSHDINDRKFYSYNRAKKITVDGEAVIIGEIQDITETMLAKESVERYTEYLEIIFNTVNDVIIIADLLGNIIDTNKAIFKVFGYSTEEIKDTSFEKIIKSECDIVDKDRYLCNGIKKDGSIIKCEIFRNDLELPNSDKMQLLVIQDVTEREALKEKVYASIAITTETIKAMAGTV